MPTLYIVAGPNGAGKTTFARRFLAGENSIFEFVNADSIAQGLAPYEPEKAALAAGRLMHTQLRGLFDRRESFAFETTLSGRTYRLLLAEMKAAGYRIGLNFLWLPAPEQSIDRVARRVVAGAIERARIFGTTLIYGDKDGNVVEVDPNELLREKPNLLRELMGNDDPPIGHWGPLPNKTY